MEFTIFSLKKFGSGLKIQIIKLNLSENRYYNRELYEGLVIEQQKVFEP